MNDFLEVGYVNYLTMFTKDKKKKKTKIKFL